MAFVAQYGRFEIRPAGDWGFRELDLPGRWVNGLRDLAAMDRSRIATPNLHTETPYPIRELWMVGRIAFARRVVSGFNSEYASRASKDAAISVLGDVDIAGALPSRRLRTMDRPMAHRRIPLNLGYRRELGSPHPLQRMAAN